MAESAEEMLKAAIAALGLRAQLPGLLAGIKPVEFEQLTKAQPNAAPTVGEALSGFPGFRLGLSPIIGGLVRLFGGDSNTEMPPLIPFNRPSRVAWEGGVSGSVPGVFEVSRGQNEMARPVLSQQITVQVQAMDSQSFLDRRDDIARAVRQAMLETNVLADVIREV